MNKSIFTSIFVFAVAFDAGIEATTPASLLREGNGDMSTMTWSLLWNARLLLRPANDFHDNLIAWMVEHWQDKPEDRKIPASLRIKVVQEIQRAKEPPVITQGNIAQELGLLIMDFFDTGFDVAKLIQNRGFRYEEHQAENNLFKVPLAAANDWFEKLNTRLAKSDLKIKLVVQGVILLKCFSTITYGDIVQEELSGWAKTSTSSLTGEIAVSARRFLTTLALWYNEICSTWPPTQSPTTMIVVDSVRKTWKSAQRRLINQYILEIDPHSVLVKLFGLKGCQNERGWKKPKTPRIPVTAPRGIIKKFQTSAKTQKKQ